MAATDLWWSWRRKCGSARRTIWGKAAAQYESASAVVNELPGWTLGGYEYEGLKIEVDDQLQYIYAPFDEGYFITIQMGGTSGAGSGRAAWDEQFADYALSEQ